jgi:cytochrome c oxidase assembly protein subunit 15
MAPVWVNRFAIFVALSTVFLLAAGALVTSTGSGLAVPDWPLSFGQFFPKMEGGVFYEHGHRMVAGTVAILTFILCYFIQTKEPRSWVRKLSLASVAVVITQAVLGGMTVLFLLPPAISVSHACLAQIFFSISVIVALTTTRYWNEKPAAWDKSQPGAITPLCISLNALFFLQLVMGATMRHKKAGLAIPDFPLSFGSIIPPEFTFPVAIHFGHRVGAVLVTLASALLVMKLFKRQPGQLLIIATGGILLTLLSVQWMLGAFIIWLKRPIPLTSTHLVVGALCLATSVVLTALVKRAETAKVSR